jgi:hypothetical protein
MPTPTREEFFANPNRWLYASEPPIPDAWLAEAWETLPEFRDNQIYGHFVREVRKLGRVSDIEHGIAYLMNLLPLSRIVEIYERVKAEAQRYEAEYRPLFDKAMGEQASALPLYIPEQDLEEYAAFTGTAYTLYPNGKICREQEYRHGLPWGRLLECYPSGHLAHFGEYVCGIALRTEIWSEDRELIAEYHATEEELLQIAERRRHFDAILKTP